MTGQQHQGQSGESDTQYPITVETGVVHRPDCRYAKRGGDETPSIERRDRYTITVEKDGRLITCDHEECCRYYLCAHPKCCGYAVPMFGGA